MDDRKQYWIKLFIKKCSSLNNYEEQVNFFIEWCSKTYNVSGNLLKEIREKYAKDDYINRLIPIIDRCFTIDDLKASIKFYSSKVGKKILDYQFLQDVGKVSKDIGEDIEKDFQRNSKNE